MRNKINELAAVAVFVGMIGVLAGCSGFWGNKVKIISISPDINTSLETGKSLDIE